ncbi:MAG: flagellar biosynthesis protein FliQ [Oscillospiraceae bacterium]
MNTSEALNLMQQAVAVAIKLSAPILIISMVIGIVISIFQAATQIHEQTITFVTKLLAIALILLMTGSWMMETMIDFFNRVFEMML